MTCAFTSAWPTATTVDDLEIHWPSSAVEHLKLPSVDRIFTVEEGKGIVGELCTTCATANQQAAKKK